jgi:Zn-dependent protease
MDQRPQWLPPQPISQPPVPSAPPPRPVASRARRLLGPLFVAGALALNFGKAALLVLPKLKVLTTAGTMLASVAAYSLIWGWKFAAGFVALLFIHEMGHFFQMRREGVKPTWMVFVPFLGAAVGARSLGDNALSEARIGLAGPIVGSLAAAALIPVGVATGDDFWRALAFTGFLLNLFNLLPIVPLDGGRAMAAMAPWMWFVGFGAAVTLLFLWPNPILILIVLLGGLELYRRWKTRRAGTYYRVKPAHRFAVGAVYVGLIALLALGMDATFLDRSDRI